VDFFYKYRDTRFHNLNPMAKLFAGLAIVSLGLLLDCALCLLALFALAFAIAAEARVLRGWLFYMKIALWISLFIVIFNLLMWQGGDTLLVSFWSLRITLESLLFGLIMSLRMAVIISAFAIMSLIISPRESMQLMRKFKIPARSVFMTSLSLRFFPALLEDVEALTEVQKARGAKLKGIRGKGPVLLPLLSNSLERSISAAEAIEARGINDFD
jgi:energy-coupling factor transport system permease protein